MASQGRYTTISEVTDFVRIERDCVLGLFDGGELLDCG
jgi:hypothetical protein